MVKRAKRRVAAAAATAQIWIADAAIDPATCLRRCFESNLKERPARTTSAPITACDRRFLFLLASTRRDGNAELLARRAARALPGDVAQRLLRLADLPLPAFEDVRHAEGGSYAMPDGHTLLE